MQMQISTTLVTGCMNRLLLTGLLFLEIPSV